LQAERDDQSRAEEWASAAQATAAPDGGR
jgi:hypothetical protein